MRLLLNIGLKLDDTFSPETKNPIQEAGQWSKANIETVFETHPLEILGKASALLNEKKDDDQIVCKRPLKTRINLPLLSCRNVINCTSTNKGHLFVIFPQAASHIDDCIDIIKLECNEEMPAKH